MKGIVLFIIFAIMALCPGQGKGNVANKYYTIIAPGTFRANSRYRMSLAVNGIKAPMDVRITLTNGTYTKRKVVKVQPESVAVAFLDIGNVQKYSYNFKLRVEGLNGIRFNETASIQLGWNDPSILIQTDKGKYKPGDRIQFRVLVIDEAKKPVDLNNQTVEAFMQDPKGNKIKQWSNITLTNGVFKSDLKLAMQPALGYWTLNFMYGPNNDIKRHQMDFVEVVDFVSPKFEVTTSLPVYNTPKRGKVIFVVEAKYKHGKPVKGKLTVAISNAEFKNALVGFRPPTVRKSRLSRKKRSFHNTLLHFPIDGKAVIALEYYYFYVSPRSSAVQFRDLVLTVREEVTENKVTSSLTLPIYNSELQISHVGTDESFKPGLANSFYVKVTRPDGKPVIDTKNPVNVAVYYGFDDNIKTDLSLKLDNQGMAVVRVTVPLSAQLLDFVIKYRDAPEYRVYLPRAKSESNNFIQAKILTKQMETFQFVRVQVIATEKIGYLYYQVIGNGGVLVTHRVNPNKKVFVFRFWATSNMVPSAFLIVYYYRPNGEIIADRVPLKFENRLDNFANIKLSATKLEPGETLDITVDTKCESYVGLLGIDQNIELLRPGNEIDRRRVFSEFSQYDSTFPDLPTTSFRNLGLEYFDPYKLLTKTGVIFFTNAKRYELKRKSYRVEIGQDGPGDLRASGGPGDPGGPEGPGDSLNQVHSSYKYRRDGLSMFGVKDFPETWIWDDFLPNDCESVKFSKKVPDTITSWLISAFSLNQANGLGLSENPTSLTVFRPFFISTTLPYSVRRGEQLTLSILITNYLSSDQEVTVTMSNDSEHFTFTDDTAAKYEDNLSRTKTVTVNSNTGSTIAVTVTPKQIGYLPIKITATCQLAGDAIEQLLLVEPEGSPVYVNKVVLLDMRTVNERSITFTIETPSGAVPESTSAEVSVFGDLLGNTIDSLESLIQIPSGWGEQNMLSFVPNLLVADYLKATQQLTDALHTRITTNLEMGYQHQLKYQRFEGSFSIFGDRESGGSTWLTAFVLRYFAESKAYISIDDGVMTRAMDWLVTKQLANGQFENDNKNIYPELQNNVGKGVGLTAHVLLGLMANNAGNKYDAAIQKATDYIIEQLKTVNHLYSLALSAYALQKQGHASAAALLKTLNAKAIEKDGLKWWEYKPTGNASYWWQYTSNLNIEITAIALATHAEAGMDTEAFPILQWLIKQRNSRGGFYSTQDTILSIEAMAKIASRLYSANTDIDVAASYEPEGLFNVKVTQDNAIALQRYVLPLNTKAITFNCKGSGLAVAQVAYKYYVTVPEPAPRFEISVSASSRRANVINLSVCSAFKPDAESSISNLTIVEVNLPSGYTLDKELFMDDNIALKRGPEDQNTVYKAYSGITESWGGCFYVDAYRTHKVNFLKPVPVRVYDYYDNSKRATAFYNVTSLNPSRTG